MKTTSSTALSTIADVATILSTAALLIVLAMVTTAVHAVSARAGSAPPRVAVTSLPSGQVTTSTELTQGSVGARVVMVEFSDYQCPFCGRFEREVMPRLKAEYINTGKISLTYRDFPLESIHPLALHASDAAQCAQRQGHYWQMHDQLFNNPVRLDETSLRVHASAVGLNMAEFNACLANGTSANVLRDIDEGHRLLVRSTPTFFVGTQTRDAHIALKREINGAQPFEVFKAAIDDVLRTSGVE